MTVVLGIYLFFMVDGLNGQSLGGKNISEGECEANRVTVEMLFESILCPIRMNISFHLISQRISAINSPHRCIIKILFSKIKMKFTVKLKKKRRPLLFLG